MDKNAIKKYAVWARNELIARVSQKAQQYGITAERYGDKNADSVNGVLLSATEKKQRQALIAKIDAEGFEQVMEEVAYTWFNRFTALRFMEVNNYLPSHTRVFTNEANEFKPQILADAISLELEGLDMDKVFELKNANKDDELYKYLLIVQCNALSSILPGMFQKIADYTELLLPDYLLRVGSVIEQMIELIPSEDWTDQVQIIGWLYQYYNSEPKDKVFADLKNNKKVTKENIPAATQLFTPDWIVRYMVENSLWRLWKEGHQSQENGEDFKYYIEEAEQPDDVVEKLKQIRIDYSKLKPEDIRCIDPCSGSGHILCYMFDVLVKIYENYGYSAREAASIIVEKNIWGLDIDNRAAQLAYFSVMMKARQYDRRFFSKSIQPNVFTIIESNGIHEEIIDAYCGNSQELKKTVNKIVSELINAKEYGSLVSVSEQNWVRLLERFDELNIADSLFVYQAKEELYPLIKVAQALSQKYSIVCTNPPYMGSGNMGNKLLDYIKKNYSNSKTDMYSVFIERCWNMTEKNGFFGMITQHSWMFLSRFEKLRAMLQSIDTINMAHLGPRAFEEIGGEVVQTTSFVKRNSRISGYKGTYFRLLEPTTQQGKEDMFLRRDNRYVADQNEFEKIYGMPVAYWISNAMMTAFSKKELGDYGKTRQGFATGDNDRFLRLWTEVDITKLITGCTSVEDFWNKRGVYAPCNKGGESRKWYGNNFIVCKFDRISYDALLSMGNHLPSREYYFKPGLTWSTLSSGFLSMRYSPQGFVFETKGSMYFADDETDNLYLLGVMNSKVAMQALQVLCPTIDFHEGPVSHVPIIVDNKELIAPIVEENIALSKEDWDSFELSWDYNRHPLIQGNSVEKAFAQWESVCRQRFQKMKSNDEKLNKLLIESYGLNGELSADVDEKTVTVALADRKRDVRSLISYAVGCMFGRYSLDESGLIYAGGEWKPNAYNTFIPDKDNIIPICDDEYFADDIVGLFINFIESAYGKENLEENLSYIALSLGGKGSSRDVIRSYFLNDFYSDHIKVYQKKPIYWLFDSGKKNGFKCLIYMHRYQSDTVARIRTDYVHEQQSRYRTAIGELEQRIQTESTSERVKLSRTLASLKEQAEELRGYEEKVHHLADQMISIDLDAGVKTNYAKLQDVLAKIK